MTTSATPAFLISATYKLHPEDAATYRELASLMVALAEHQDGCEFFNVSEDVISQATFKLFEGWTSDEALGVWFNNPQFQDLLTRMLRLRVLDRHAEKIFVSRTDKIPMPE
jgi:quinol monooxygenase YgiN